MQISQIIALASLLGGAVALPAAKALKENPNLGVPGVPNLAGIAPTASGASQKAAQPKATNAPKENPNLGVPGVPNLAGIQPTATGAGGAKKAAKANGASGASQQAAQPQATNAPKENPNLGVPGVPNLAGIARS